MKPTTDIEQVKSVARALLMTEVYKTPYSPMVVQHPFTSSGFVATTKDGVMQLIDITESEENLQAWQSFMRKQINSTDNAYEIYMMTNKPYSLTFLKYASPYLSKADFSKILADAWIRSENPNCDTNVSKSKLISMFKQADPHELMLEDELRQYEELDDTVTVYRGVTSHNAKNIKALSWTLDREKAEWFAHRFNEDGTVYEHRSVFENAIKGMNTNNKIKMCALYLLTADGCLWGAAKRHIGKDEIHFFRIRLGKSTPTAYTLFCCAKDLALGSKHMTISDLADGDVVNPKDFAIICNAMAIRRYGLGAIQYKYEGEKVC